jgi:hypothetical protein
MDVSILPAELVALVIASRIMGAVRMKVPGLTPGDPLRVRLTVLIRSRPRCIFRALAALEGAAWSEPLAQRWGEYNASRDD